MSACTQRFTTVVHHDIVQNLLLLCCIRSLDVYQPVNTADYYSESI